MTSAARNLTPLDNEQSQERRKREQWVEGCRGVGAIRAELLMELGMTEIRIGLLRCLSSIEVGFYRGRIKVIPIYPCGLRFICPICHCFWRSRHAKKYGARLRELVERGYRLYFLTLTVTSVPALTRQFISVLWVCWKKFRRHKLFDCCIGTLAVMEMKRGARGWHVHLHIILAAESMVSIEAVSIEWYELTKGFSVGYQVNIKPVEVASIERIIRYMLKYPSIEKAEDMRTLFNVARGQNLVRATGWARSNKGSKSRR